ncbi:MAG: zinc-dependent metalloprotease [bacterium]
MKNHIFCAFVLIFALTFFCLKVSAQENPKEKVKQDTTKAQAKEEGEKKEKKKKGKPFEEVVEDFEVIQGLFTFYKKEDQGKVYMEIKPQQIDKIYLCSITREAGDGYYFDSAAMMGRFPFIFKRIGQKVLFIHKNVYFRADKDAAIHRAIARGVPNSIIGSAKIESEPHPERGSILVDPSGFFIQDIGMVSYIFSEFIKNVKYNFDKENSYFGMLKSFSENTEIEVVLNFTSSNPKPTPTIPDDRSFQHTYHYSLSTIPETDYQPRLADDRVGHFLTMYQDYTSVLRDSPYNRYINRWHLAKAEPKFKVSPPKKPIVYWLENTIPVEYRQAVKEGLLLWNKAFERIGFKDAIVVKQQPDDADWDPADVRYNTVRWIVQPGGGYAVGPSRTNPFTGQIYDADIRVSADFLRYVFRGYEEFAKPVAMGDSISTSLGILGNYSQGFCDFQNEAVQQAAFGWSLLSARGLVGKNDVDIEKYLHNLLIWLIAHEVGHTLGLRHNFKASTIHPVDQLQNKQLTTEQGITSSVMDYIPVNIAPEGRKQGQYYQTTLGPYDYWAIEYAYKPIDADSPESELAILEKIASRVADPEIPYGTDEDAFGGARGIDPSCNRWDLGTDPIAFYRDRINLAQELWSKIVQLFEKKGNRYQKFRLVFNQGISQYFTAVMNVTKYIGGIYHRRDHVGDPNGRIPFEPVQAAKQRDALEFLKKNVFGPQAFNVSPDLLNRLAPERFWDFSGSIWQMKRIDYPIHDIILSIQTSPLTRLYDPILLGRMLDIELRYNKSEEPFTMADMFEGIREAIWSELAGPTNVNSFRRALQRAHLDKLITLVVKPAKGVPEDACTLARADLVKLKSEIDRALSNGELDAYTQAHLDETHAQIEAALKAGIERQLGL